MSRKATKTQKIRQIARGEPVCCSAERTPKTARQAIASAPAANSRS
jgi:hypothetical protein